MTNNIKLTIAFSMFLMQLTSSAYADKPVLDVINGASSNRLEILLLKVTLISDALKRFRLR